MSEETIQQPAPRSSGTSPTGTHRWRFRIGALIVVAVAVGLTLWLVLRDSPGSSESAAPGSVSAVTAAGMRQLATSSGRPIFWFGPQRGYTYELTRQPNGSAIVRYLPSGVKVGSKSPYLSVATYPFPGAFAAIKKVASQPGNTSFRVNNGGLAEYTNNYPQSVHVAYPGVDYQMEVYDPGSGTAIALAKAGKLLALGNVKSGASTAAAAKPVAASLAALQALPASLGHPVYWVGARHGRAYELTQTGDGKVIIRYLPPGEPAGSKKAYLSVGTYPFKGAFEATKALSSKAGVETINLKAGGLAVIDRSYPASIHLAYPGSDYQIEVYAPSARTARDLVASGQVSTVG